MAGTKKGIFCLEGAWERRLDDRKSVISTLELVERITGAKFIHRDVATPEELNHYLGEWSRVAYSAYDVLYLAFHGSAGAIQIGRDVVHLDDLAEILDGAIAGRIVYFGSCNVLRDRKAVESFLQLTGAKAVCGYTKEVDWVESSAFDVLLLPSLVEDIRVDARFNRLRKRYPDITRLLGFANYPRFDRANSVA